MTMPTDDGKSHEDQGGILGEAQDAAIEDHIVSLLDAGRKMAAIKLYRRQTGASLKDAKDFVEALAAKHGIGPKAAGCAGMALLLVAVSTIIVVGMWALPG
jgi:ribosomal protein L7/L12